LHDIDCKDKTVRESDCHTSSRVLSQ